MRPLNLKRWKDNIEREPNTVAAVTSDTWKKNL
jgi:hypothetical protein